MTLTNLAFSLRFGRYTFTYTPTGSDGFRHGSQCRLTSRSSPFSQVYTHLEEPEYPFWSPTLPEIRSLTITRDDM